MPMNHGLLRSVAANLSRRGGSVQPRRHFCAPVAHDDDETVRQSMKLCLCLFLGNLAFHSYRIVRGTDEPEVAQAKADAWAQAQAEAQAQEEKAALP